MKLTKFGNLLVIGVALSLSAVGCKHRPQGVTPLPNAGMAKVGDNEQGKALTPGTGPESSSPTTQMEIPQAAPEAWKDATEDTETLKSQSVYFAYDSSAIRTSEKGKVAAVADYMKGNPSVGVRVEGNCDERGTEEYNRALGVRRALAAREMLVRQGIDPSRVLTISYGKDRPIEPLHSEAAWSKNRRDDFVVLTKPK